MKWSEPQNFNKLEAARVEGRKKKNLHLRFKNILMGATFGCTRPRSGNCISVYLFLVFVVTAGGGVWAVFTSATTVSLQLSMHKCANALLPWISWKRCNFHIKRSWEKHLPRQCHINSSLEVQRRQTKESLSYSFASNSSKKVTWRQENVDGESEGPLIWFNNISVFQCQQSC